MIRLFADENMVGLDALPPNEVEVVQFAGRALDAASLRNADVLWVRSVTQVDAALLRESRLRFVGTATAGTEHVDQQVLMERGIPFAAAPGANANAVVEYVVAALAELEAPWRALEQGDRLGIIGYGHVGRRLGDFASAMGWQVCVYDPWLNEGDVNCDVDQSGTLKPVSFEELLRCRVISLHCDLHDRSPWPSRHLLDRAAFASLDASQWLINASRGAVVDSEALRHRFAAGSAPVCVLDVWEGEPQVDVNLLTRDEVRLATPHIAGYSWDSKLQATQMLHAALQSQDIVREPMKTASTTPPALHLDGAFGTSSLDAARSLFAQRYRIIEDCQRLQAAFHLSQEERAREFDRLRRDYPVRRELRGSELQTPSELANAPELRRLVRALGLCWRCV